MGGCDRTEIELTAQTVRRDLLRGLEGRTRASLVRAARGRARDGEAPHIARHAVRAMPHAPRRWTVAILDAVESVRRVAMVRDFRVVSFADGTFEGRGSRAVPRQSGTASG